MPQDDICLALVGPVVAQRRRKQSLIDPAIGNSLYLLPHMPTVNAEDALAAAEASFASFEALLVDDSQQRAARAGRRLRRVRALKLPLELGDPQDRLRHRRHLRHLRHLRHRHQGGRGPARRRDCHRTVIPRISLSVRRACIDVERTARGIGARDRLARRTQDLLPRLLPLGKRLAALPSCHMKSFVAHQTACVRFTAHFLGNAGGIKIGPSLQAGSGRATLAHARRLPTTQAIVDNVCARGCRIETSCGRLAERCSFFAPTVFTVVTVITDDTLVMTPDLFNPVPPCARFTGLDAGIRHVNRLTYGQGPYAIANSACAALVIQNGLEVSMVNSHHIGDRCAGTVFSGVKDSGMGSGGGVKTINGWLSTNFVTQIN